MTTEIVLPDFEILKKQPKKPHRATVVVERVILNEHGQRFVYAVWSHRGSWWVQASCAGYCMSNMLHTKTESKAKAWMAAIKQGCISVAD